MLYASTMGRAVLDGYAVRGVPAFFLIDFSANRWFVSPLEHMDRWGIAARTERATIPAPARSFGSPELGYPHLSPPVTGAAFRTASRDTIRIVDPIPPDRSLYGRSFRYVQAEQRRGNSFLCNLTFPSRVALAGGGLADAYGAARAEFKLLVADSRVAANPFCVFTPEGFVRIRGERIETLPMKGTRFFPGIGAAETEKEALYTDAKEDAEHRTVVDLLRNDLGIVCRSVWVDSYRYARCIRLTDGYLWATSSRISGMLSREWIGRPGSLLAALAPGGSVSGAPKAETLRIIGNAEIDERGFYTGIAGIAGPWGLDSWILIRFLEETETGHVFRSGGGITVYSDEAAEYRELEAKIAIPVR